MDNAGVGAYGSQQAVNSPRLGMSGPSGVQEMMVLLSAALTTLTNLMILTKLMLLKISSILEIQVDLTVVIAYDIAIGFCAL